MVNPYSLTIFSPHQAHFLLLPSMYSLYKLYRISCSFTNFCLLRRSILSVLLSPSLSWTAPTLLSKTGPPIQKGDHSLQHEIKCPSVLQKSPVFTVSFPHHTYVNVLPIRHDPWTCEHISNFSAWLAAGAP